jgi:hypothetical protein
MGIKENAENQIDHEKPDYGLEPLYIDTVTVRIIVVNRLAVSSKSPENIRNHENGI